MGKISIKRILITVGIIVIILFMIGITYIHFNYEKTDNEKIVDLNQYIDVKYNETSNVTIVNATKDYIVNKSFSIKNTYNKTLYYSIVLSNVTNNFDKNSLVFSLISDDGAYIEKSYIINDNYILASLIKIEPSNTHEYKFNLKVTTSDTNNKTFSSNIKVNVLSLDSLYDFNSLYAYVIGNNPKLYKNELNIEDGVYYTNNSINGNTVYFYRGTNELNNNLVLGNYCYKIIRTTEDLGVRIIYNGKFNNGICDGENNTLDLTTFNNNSNYNAYVGYIYGSANSSNYESEHENVNPSNIMKKVNEFYQNNLVKYSSYIANSIYCSNRKTDSFVLNSVKYDILGYKNYNTGYNSMYRLLNNEVSYNCENNNDRLNNERITYPIGLLSADEAFYAGLNRESENTLNYLNSSLSYWTITPAYYNGINAYNFIIEDGKISESEVNKEHAIRPVITLKNSVKVKSGNGNYDNPYILE